MRQHVFNLAGNRATVTQYDPEDPEWCIKFYCQGQYCKGADRFTEDESNAIGIAQYTLQHWKAEEATQ